MNVSFQSRQGWTKHPCNCLIAAAVMAVLMLAACGASDSQESLALSGKVVDGQGVPVSGAVVKIPTTEISSISDDQGKFSIQNQPAGTALSLTAWAMGFYIKAADDVYPGDEDITIILQAHPAYDNPDYDWLSSVVDANGEGENQGCSKCHSSVGSGLGIALPVDEWLQDAHSQTGGNLRFLNMYYGTDAKGNQSPLTQFGYSRDYGQLPLLPDPAKPYYGPGYRLDFPGTTGNCAACHLPAAAINTPYGVDPAAAVIQAEGGIPCDFCHKIWDVTLDPNSGLPIANMPGVLSYKFLRPPEGHQFFAGPFDDVGAGEDTFSPVQTQSQFCAPCHYGVFWDTTIYNSFGEWLESPYSDPDNGKTCQDCHMPHSGVSYFALPEQGGLLRDPSTIVSHLMPGASSNELLQNSVTLTADSEFQQDKVIVTVTIHNDQTGHHVPTDSPLRQMILLVSATDEQENPLVFLDGPVVPEWGGVGDPSSGYFAGLPGKGYAKILTELWTGVSPSGSYWNPTQTTSDTRIPAMESDTGKFVFKNSGSGDIRVEVRLIYRRAFISLAEQKGWEIPDILMESETLVLSRN
jgi:hypothetical protein